MTAKTATPIEFPVPFADVPGFLYFCITSRDAAAQLLGEPMLTSRIDGLGDADFWAFRFPCGLMIAYELLHSTGEMRVVADSPELSHTLRHLVFTTPQWIKIDDGAFESEIKLLLTANPERKHEIASLHSFQVWRQGDDGNAFSVGDPTSERDAKCFVSHLESLGHKQLYWYDKVNSE